MARELTALARRLPGRFGGSARYAQPIEQHRAVVRPLEDEILGAVARPLWVLLGAAAIVLLVACVNVANRFLVRAEGRQRELAVRRAIGAARGQLIRRQMAEAVVLAVLAGACALALAHPVQLSFTLLTLWIASGLALILGAVGLYGVLSYIVAERTRVRMALGARAEEVRRMVVRQGARVVAVGVAVGMTVALASTRVLGSLLYGVRALDAGTFAAMAGAMVLTGLLASYLPARRALNVDPIEALRTE